MALTNAQRQANYRERQLKSENGNGSRLDLVIDDAAHLALIRLAKHSGQSVRSILASIAMAEQRRVLDGMGAAEQSAYFDAVTR